MANKGSNPIFDFVVFSSLSGDPDIPSIVIRVTCLVGWVLVIRICVKFLGLYYLIGSERFVCMVREFNCNEENQNTNTGYCKVYDSF